MPLERNLLLSVHKVIWWKCRKSSKSMVPTGILYVITDAKPNSNWFKRKRRMYCFTQLESPDTWLTSGKVWSSSPNCITNNLTSLQISALPSVVWLYPQAPPQCPLLPVTTMKLRIFLGSQNKCLRPLEAFTPYNLIDSMEEREYQKKNKNLSFPETLANVFFWVNNIGLIASPWTSMG